MEDDTYLEFENECESLVMIKYPISIFKVNS